VIDDSDMAALFGLEMAEPSAAEMPVPLAPMRAKRSKPPAGKNVAAAAKAKRAEKKAAKDRGASGKIALALAKVAAKGRASGNEVVGRAGKPGSH
jgi:predicted flavoprotein YhiN